MKTLLPLFLMFTLPFILTQCGSDDRSKLAAEDANPADNPISQDDWSSPLDKKLFEFIENRRVASNAEIELLRKGANPNAKTPVVYLKNDKGEKEKFEGDRAILTYAADRVSSSLGLEWVKMLLGWGADPDASDFNWKRTALMALADPNQPASARRLEAIKMLISFGADATLENNRGENALAIAKQKAPFKDENDNQENDKQAEIITLLTDAMKKTPEDRQADRLSRLKKELETMNKDKDFGGYFKEKEKRLKNLIEALEKGQKAAATVDHTNAPYVVAITVAGPDADVGEGYEKVGDDLNAHTKRRGKELYLYVKRGVEMPLTDLDVNAAKRPEDIKTLDGFTNVEEDLNKGAGGFTIRLSYTTDAKHGGPLKDVIIVHDAKSADAAKQKIPPGYRLIEVDLNTKAGGDYIFIAFKR